MQSLHLFVQKKLQHRPLHHTFSRRVRAQQRGWQALLTLLLLTSMIILPVMPVRAEPNAPESSPTHKPSAAVQMYTAGVQMAPLLPKLLGFNEPQTYLLLLQNNHELRATGGFITAVGRLTLENGRVTELVLEDSYDIARHDVDHPLAPDPVKQFMDIELLFLRDSNWSPDFPTSARLASSLYAQDAGVQTDGVISIDLHAVELLVGALAPLQVPGSDVVLTGDNVMEEIMHFWDRPPTSEVDEAAETDSLLDRKDWVYQRKDFIPLLADAAIVRLQSGKFNPLSLLNGITDALNQRAIQIWLDDPLAAELIAKQGWDGSLHPQEDADFVALVDMNMGYNKVNAVLERSLSHTVTWPDGPAAPAQATVAVTYDHPLNVVDELCAPMTDFGTLASYAELIARCYFGYVRLYVPMGSELIAIEGVEKASINVQAGENGTMVLAGYFSMKPGEEHTVTFTYALPPRITRDNYKLIVQRQAGVGPLPLAITVDDTAFSLTLTDGQLTWPAAEPAKMATR